MTADARIRAAWESIARAHRVDPSPANAERIASLVECAAVVRDDALALRNELRAIIDGRTVPPTDAEIAAHWRAGGSWLVQGVTVLRGVEETQRYRDQSSWAAIAWLPIRNCRPCAWPETPA